jgi:putative spermidine/putrescine transport system ATP-binding protein
VTAALEVRDLHVLFGGTAAPPLFAQTSVSGLLVDAVTHQQLARFPGTRLGLAGLSFAVAGGECLAVLGVSGSGKSSLLRTLAGLQPTFRGTVLVNGQDVSALPPERRNIVYLHQEPVLFPHLSVLENVAFPMTIRGVERRAALVRAFEWMQRLHTGELAGFFPQSLSGGQRHRVALARALCADPAVLLLDEPLASLDPAVRREVRTALQEARAASGAAMLLVTHDLDDALSVATHLCSIERFGNLSTPATPSEMLAQPPSLETARVLGVFAELPGRVAMTSSGPVFQWIGGVLPAPGGETGDAVAFVRAHEIELHHGDASDTSALTVTTRRDGVHESTLTLRNAAGEEVQARVGSAVSASPGDVVQLVVHTARIFPAD